MARWGLLIVVAYGLMALLTPLLSLILVMLFLASTSGTRWASAMRRLVAGLKATNSKPMVPLKREQIYDR
jgi:hypothetical protein